MRIDCDDCRMQSTDACADCVVSFIVGREPGDAVVIDVAEVRAVRLLAQAGLVPDLRHEPAAEAAACSKRSRGLSWYPRSCSPSTTI